MTAMVMPESIPMPAWAVWVAAWAGPDLQTPLAIYLAKSLVVAADVVAVALRFTVARTCAIRWISAWSRQQPVLILKFVFLAGKNAIPALLRVPIPGPLHRFVSLA